MFILFEKIIKLIPFTILSRKRYEISLSQNDETEKTLQALIVRLDLLFDIDTAWNDNKMGNLKAMSDISSVLHNGKRRWNIDA